MALTTYAELKTSVGDWLNRSDLTTAIPDFISLAEAQIERNLRDLIVNGHLKPGEAMPGEWDLADLYGVSRLTVRRALDELVRQNWLEKKHGVGTFVRQPTMATIAASKLSFTEQMRAIGREPSSKFISQHVIAATESALAGTHFAGDALPDDRPERERRKGRGRSDVAVRTRGQVVRRR